MSRSTIRSFLLLGLAASQACVCRGSSISDSGGLRASAAGDNASKDREFKRQSVIRRLYGSENGEVRKHVRLLEEKSERSRTGFLGDPYHEVPYENHPYQASYDHRRQRRLQDTEFVESIEEGVINTGTIDDTSNTATTTTTDANPYRPMRITFETQALDDTRNAQNAAKIDFIKTQILPK